MIDIPSIATILSGTPLSPIANVAPVAVIPSAVPQQLLNILRQTEVTGTITQPPSPQAVTISTAQGVLTLTLPQQANAQQEKLQQQLITLFQTQRPITVILHTGSPPTQAMLLLPALMHQPQESRTAAQQNLTTTRAALNTTNATNAPISAPLTAIVLPHNISWPQGAAPTALSAPNNTPAATPNAVQSSTTHMAASHTSPQIQSQDSQTLMPAPQQGTSEHTSNLLPRLINLLTTGQTQPAAQNFSAAPALNNPQAPRTGSSTTPAPSTTAPPPLLTAGKEISVKIITPALLPPSVPIPPDALPAIVSGHGPNGEAIIKLDTASLYIKNAPALTTGTTVYVTLEDPTPAINPATLPPRDPDAVALALQNLLGEVMNTNPALARHFIQSNLFQPAQATPSPLLFFMNALNQGGIQNWLGQSITDTLNRTGKFALITKAMDEIKRASTPTHDATVGEWQSYPMPIFLNNHVHSINFYVHNKNTHDDDTGSISTTKRTGYIRFLIELNMTKLGAVQIDGLVHQRKLDILVRSASPLPPALQNDLKQSYIQSLLAIDYSGNLDFQTGRQHWLYMQQKGMKSLLT